MAPFFIRVWLPNTLAMSQKNQVSKATYSKRKRSVPKTQSSSQTPRIKSAILHGKPTPIQSYRGLNLVRFEHENGKDGAMVVIAEELPFRRRNLDIPPGQQINISEQAGKHFKVICAYQTSIDCVDEDFNK